MRNPLLGPSLFFLALGCVQPGRPAAALTLTPTNIDIPGAYSITATGINDRGAIVGQWSLPPFNPVPIFDFGFLYRNGVFTDIAVPGGQGTYPQAINDRGQIAGYYFGDGPGPRGFVYSGGSYLTFAVPGADFTYANGINNAGQVVGFYGTASVAGAGGPQHGFLYSGGRFTTIDAPGATRTFPSAINDRGQIVGQADNQHVVEKLGLPAITNYFGFVDTNGTFAEYPGLGLTGINDRGDLTGRNFVIRQGELETIDLAGPITMPGVPFALRLAINGIDDLGDLVGGYTEQSQGFLQDHGFLAHLPPRRFAVSEPGTLSLITVALVGYLLRSRRRS